MMAREMAKVDIILLKLSIELYLETNLPWGSQDSQYNLIDCNTFFLRSDDLFI